MVEAGSSGTGSAGVLNTAPAGRLRPARPEEGFGLVWEPELPFLQAAPFAFGIPAVPLPFPMPGLAPQDLAAPPAWFTPLDWPLPRPPLDPAAAGQPAEVSDWPGFETPATPAAFPFDAGAPPAAPTWLPPETWGAGPQPFPFEPPVSEPGAGPGAGPPRPPGLPSPMFPAPELEGGAVRQVTVPEGDDDVIHQPGVTDRAAEGLGWRITGGADAALLLMDPASGALRFLAAPDFEQPGDADGDNRYELVFEVRDGWGAVAAQRLVIAVEDVVWG